MNTHVKAAFLKSHSLFVWCLGEERQFFRISSEVIAELHPSLLKTETDTDVNFISIDREMMQDIYNAHLEENYVDHDGFKFDKPNFNKVTATTALLAIKESLPVVIEYERYSRVNSVTDIMFGWLTGSPGNINFVYVSSDADLSDSQQLDFRIVKSIKILNTEVEYD